MRCDRARRLLELKTSHTLGQGRERELADHLGACPECAALEDELEQAWQALAWHPTVEPSPDFLFRLKARIRAEQFEPRPRSIWHPNLNWRWVGLAACILLAVVVLARFGPMRPHDSTRAPGQNVAIEHDRWDDQFLEDLDQTLWRSDLDYLSTYDSWPASAQEPAGFSSKPGKPVERSKKKEIS
jgi:hypothetical protein